MNNMPSNETPDAADELQPEYRFDYRQAKSNRFATDDGAQRRMVVVLDEDVAEVFNTPESVNQALRDLMRLHPSIASEGDI